MDLIRRNSPHIHQRDPRAFTREIPEKARDRRIEINHLVCELRVQQRQQRRDQHRRIGTLGHDLQDEFDESAGRFVGLDVEYDVVGSGHEEDHVGPIGIVGSPGGADGDDLEAAVAFVFVVGHAAGLDAADVGVFVAGAVCEEVGEGEAVAVAGGAAFAEGEGVA